MTEAEIQCEIRKALGLDPDLVLWRNNSGAMPSAAGGAPVRFGLAKGASDLIGICAGRFIALECKTPKGKPTQDQLKFIQLVRRKRGFAAIVRSVDDALAAVQRCKAGAVE